jgi:hypothetical protein
LIALAVLSAAALHLNTQAGALEVLHRMAAANASIKTYKVRIHFDAHVRTFVSLPLSLDATLYYKQPDKTQIVFDSVPQLAKQFQSFYASSGSPQTWPKSYAVTIEPPAPSAANSVTLRLTPKDDGGSLDHALITVETTTYGIVGQQWLYKDGSNIDVVQFNETGAAYVLPNRQIGDFNFPRYNAHVVADYDAYDINVPIPDSVFKKTE